MWKSAPGVPVESLRNLWSRETTWLCLVCNSCVAITFTRVCRAQWRGRTSCASERWVTLMTVMLSLWQKQADCRTHATEDIMPLVPCPRKSWFNCCHLNVVVYLDPCSRPNIHVCVSVLWGRGFGLWGYSSSHLHDETIEWWMNVVVYLLEWSYSEFTTRNYVYHLHVLAFHECINCVYVVVKRLVYECVMKNNIIVIVYYVCGGWL